MGDGRPDWRHLPGQHCDIGLRHSCVAARLAGSAGRVRMGSSSRPSTPRPGPVIPGLHNDHPLSMHQVGDVLITELNCIACHADPEMRLSAKLAPDLADVGMRIDPQFMQRFIADPAAAVPGTTMPNMLAGRSADERKSVAADIAAFLIDLAPETLEREAASAERRFCRTRSVPGCRVCRLSPAEGYKWSRGRRVRHDHTRSRPF